MAPEIRDDRQQRALTGVSEEKFAVLEKAFAQVLQEERERVYQEQQAQGKRQRALGGGQKGKLSTPGEKLLFILYYLKVYPTFDVLGAHFGLARSTACETVHGLLSILCKTLVKLGVFPHREFKTVAEFRQACHDIETLLIDATERPHCRPAEAAEQQDLYSGKKKRHTVKNTIIATPQKWIVFVGSTFSGRQHDYSMLKAEFPPDQPWFATFQALLDLGYQGIQGEYEGARIEIPHKKPRKSKKNPQPTLPPEQKAANQKLSRIRVLVENAIAGIKRFNIVVQAFRNRKPGVEDDVIALAAGLWNFLLS